MLRLFDPCGDDGVQSAAYVGADYATQTDAAFLTYGEVQGGGGFFIFVR